MKDAQSAVPGCVLLDVRRPDMDGHAVQQAMNQRGIAMPVVVLTGDIGFAIRAMKAGFARLDDVAGRAVHAGTAQLAIAGLTGRERDVLTGLAQGLATKVIAHELQISPRTVEVHRANLMTKLGVVSLSGALRLAFAVGLGDEDTAA